MKKNLLLILGITTLVFYCQSHSFSQSTDSKWEFRGYLKYMQSINLVEGFDSLWVDNLIHNRLNISYYPKSNLKFSAEVRNRIFYGDLVRLIPSYSSLVDSYNDYFDLSFTVVDQSNLVFQSMLDRLYFQWTKDKFELTLGRQRINWGISLAWNPNDIFNAYSFFDFDYEERPGTDGLRLRYYTGFASSIELASNVADDLEDWVAGGLWKINKWNYDFQLLGGVMEGDVVIGGGWSGNISKAGFRSEFSYFAPYLESNNEKSVFTAVASLDYMFPSTLYLYGSYLFNNIEGSQSDILGFGLINSRLSAKNLMPFKHSILLQAQYTFDPLFSGGFAFMFFPVENGGFFINPNLKYSLAENLDLDLIGQIYFANINNELNALAKYMFWRIKWSF